MIRPERKRNRLEGYDYSSDALYFITSCVVHRDCIFGTIVGNEMQLNEFGLIAEKQWHWLAERNTYVVLHAFVVMPNHIHGVIEIKRDDADVQKVKTLSELIGAYKTTTSKLIRLAGKTDFAWQRSFHDHIIRHERAYTHIVDYIHSNPARWQEDMFYPS